MNPKSSRWVSGDPAGWELINPMEKDDEGKLVPKQDYSMIEGLNWYSYVSNNPVKYIDPTGESATIAGLLTGAIAGGVSAVIQNGWDGRKIIAGVSGGAIPGAAIGFAIDTGGFGAILIAGFTGGTAGSLVEGWINGDNVEPMDAVKDGIISMAGSAVGYGISKAGTKLLDNFLENSLDNGLLKSAIEKAVGEDGITMGAAMKYLENAKIFESVVTTLSEMAVSTVSDMAQDNN